MVRRSGNVVRQCGRLIHPLPSRTPRVVMPNLPMMVATVVYTVLPPQCVVKQTTFFARLCLGPIIRHHTGGVMHLTYSDHKLCVVIILAQDFIQKEDASRVARFKRANELKLTLGTVQMTMNTRTKVHCCAVILLVLQEQNYVVCILLQRLY